jgi:hypothetical protein
MVPCGRQKLYKSPMSRRSLLALLRGSDGRSIGRSLAALVLVNVLLAGLHGGAMAQAAATSVPAICTLAGANGDPGHPANDPDYRACCVLGCLTAVANVVPPDSPVLADEPPAIALPVFVTLAAGHATPHPLAGPANPRGPPLLG